MVKFNVMCVNKNYHNIITLQIDVSEGAYCIRKKTKDDCFERAALYELYNDLKEQGYPEGMQRQNTEAQSAPAYHKSSNYEYGEEFEFFGANGDNQLIWIPNSKL